MALCRSTFTDARDGSQPNPPAGRSRQRGVIRNLATGADPSVPTSVQK